MPYRRLVSQQIANAHFPFGTRAVSQEKILNVLWDLRLNRRTAGFLYCPKIRIKIGVRPPHPRAGRPSTKQEATYLISALNLVWMRAFGKKPRLNRRGHNSSAFVLFAEPILASIGIHNALDNFYRYRNYVKRISKIIDRRGALVIRFAK